MWRSFLQKCDAQNVCNAKNVCNAEKVLEKLFFFFARKFFGGKYFFGDFFCRFDLFRLMKPIETDFDGNLPPLTYGAH